jgi:hypothetical protein
MRKIFIWVNSILGLFSLRLSRLNSKEELQQLIRKLAPRKVDYHLIRIGESGDGGYLVPDDLEGIRYCFSPGVAETATFESHLEKLGIKCFLADLSIESPPKNDPPFHFTRKFLGNQNTKEFMTLESWINVLEDKESDLMLQMDIEGAEYETLLAVSDETLARFRILVIEFHQLGSLIENNFFRFANPVFVKILENFNVVHIHPNNYSAVAKYGSIQIPETMEITFLRKDRSKTFGFVLEFPHPLDCKNAPNRPDVALPNNWLISK